MSDEFDPGQHREVKAEADADSVLPPNRHNKFPRLLVENVLEIFNPFETLDEPGLGLALLAVVVVVVVAALIMGGLWVAAQEAFFAGGPPQGLGLK